MKIDDADKVTSRLLSGCTPEAAARADEDFAGRSIRQNLADTLTDLSGGLFTGMLEGIVTQAAEGSPAEALEAARALSAMLGPLFAFAGEMLMDDA